MAALDTSIYGMVNPPQPVADPLAQYGKALSIQSLTGANELQQLQTQQLKKGMATEEAVSSAIKQSGGNAAAIRDAYLKAGDVKGLQAFDKAQAEKVKADSDLQKTDRENFVALAKHAHDELKTVTPDTWQTYRDNMIKRAGMFKTPEMRDTALQSAQSLPPQYDQTYIQRANVDAAKLFTPDFVEVDDGQTKRMVDKNPFTNPAVLGMATQKQTTPGERLTDERTRTEGAANRGVTLRGQNLVNARAEEAATRDGNKDKVQIVTNTDGTFTVVDKNTRIGKPVLDAQGNELKGRQNMTEAQGKAAGMFHRAEAANSILNTLEDSGNTNRGVIKQAAGAIPLIGGAAEMGVNMLPGALGGPSSEQQKVEQARRDFVNAALRVESGAAISDSEFRNAERQYFPMPGDTPATLKQKRESRQRELEALKLQAGPGSNRQANLAPPPDKSVLDAAPSREAIDAELRRRGVIK